MMTVNWHPDRAQLRSFGVVALVVFGALGAVAFVWQTLLGLALSGPVSVRVALGFGVAAAASGILAATAPAGLLPLYRGLTAVSLPIGWVVSHAVMAIVFFGVLTPIGLVLRVARRDPLARGREPARGRGRMQSDRGRQEFLDESGRGRSSILGEFWAFLRESKKWWLLPILVVLLIFGALILLSGTAVAPFIYTLF